MNILKQRFELPDLSMGMSSDYLIASQNFSTFLRIVLVFLVKETKKF